MIDKEKDLYRFQEFYTVGLRDGKAFVESKETV